MENRKFQKVGGAHKSEVQEYSSSITCVASILGSIPLLWPYDLTGAVRITLAISVRVCEEESQMKLSKLEFESGIYHQWA